ncbi:MAG: hypothetical protein IJN13_00250 [Bacilli bacterium]|nr:hypothetical protein [Bacilli bacterium]
MQVVNKKMCVIVTLVLVIIESCTLFLMYKSFGNKNTNLDEVNLNISNANMFAIMLEQDDGTYKEDTTNTWPTSGYTYNASMSGCIDINGNRIDNALTYDSTNNIATVDTGNTSYCYLYFSLPPNNLYKLCEKYNNVDICIKNEINNLNYINDFLNVGIEEDGYRYIGENPNNYMCFGTTNKEECVNNTSKYMYRIVGIFEDNDGNKHVKLTTSDYIGMYAWHNTGLGDISWEDSDLYKGINGSYFLTNPQYDYMQNNVWLNKIEDWNYIATTTYTWMYDEESGDAYAYGFHFLANDPKTIYLYEMNKEINDVCYSFHPDYYIEVEVDCDIGDWKVVKSKIGLNYAADILLSSYDNGNFTFTSWNNKTTYLITKDYWGGGSFAYLAESNSFSGNSALNIQYPVRPVFYLTSDIKLSGGTGTSTDPYIIN